MLKESLTAGRSARRSGEGMGTLSKMTDAVQTVARSVMAVPVGGQLPTTSELAKHSGTAPGTIQAALRQLEESGAVVASSHGSHGRRIRGRDLSLLWDLSRRGAFTGVLPLPESREFAGLATSLTELAHARGLPLQLLFRQGSRLRLEILQSERVEFVVASAAVAHNSVLPTAALTLSPYTYYRQDSVVVITRRGQERGRPARVPIDRKSLDHARLTESEFPDAELVDTPYLFIPELVADGTFEAAVWHQSTASTLMVASGLSLHPMRHRPLELDGALGRAALVWRRSDTAVANLISELFPAFEIEAIQQEVMSRVRIPEF